MRNIDDALNAIHLDRMTDDLWRLVNIPSPTGNERAMALAYADMLRDAGAEVEVDESTPEGPRVIAHLKGTRLGRMVQLGGHFEQIDVPHAEPARDDEIISGRGCEDMKAGLCGMLEVVRVLKGGNGAILVTAYGMHEAPAGDGSGVRELIHRGVKGDAAVVFEGSHASDQKAVVAGLGQSVWNATLSRAGEVCHELNRSAEADDLIDASSTVGDALRMHARALRAGKNEHPLLRDESLFIGQFHYGDFYNRVPTGCSPQGRRRWYPGRDRKFARKELDGVIACTGIPVVINAATDWHFVGEAYEVDLEEDIVRALRSAHSTVTGRDMPLAGTAVITDVNPLVVVGGVPSVPCPFDVEFAHVDHEFVRIGNLLRSCKVGLLTVLNYFAEEG